MRWTYFIFLQFLIVAIVAGIIYIHKDRVIVIKSPPASLAQWYKPENKRQVWLHNMFKLRREIQAVRFYSNNVDPKNMEKWAMRLSKHYLKIAEMVPEWKNKLNTEIINHLQKSIKNNNYHDVSIALDDLNKNCDSCHSNYRVITAIKYRAPDFSSMELNTSIPLNKHMKKLTQQVNMIKIATKDGMKDIALSSLSELTKGMNALGETCSTCHKKDSREYPGNKIKLTIKRLEKSLRTGTLKEQGENLGTLAVLACARCHGTHRLAYDSRKIFTDKPNWLKLIKH